MRNILFVLSALFLAGSGPSQATTMLVGSATINFLETSTEPGENPLDIFNIVNTSDDGVNLSQVVIDLIPSVGSVFFDLDEIPERLKIDGEDATSTGLLRRNISLDEHSISFRFLDFNPGEELWFFIDVDGPGNDSLARQVLGAEFAGSTAEVEFATVQNIELTLLSLTFADNLNTLTPLDARATGVTVIPAPNTFPLLLTGIVSASLLRSRKRQQNGAR
jgi:hypothetical protein